MFWESQQITHSHVIILFRTCRLRALSSGNSVTSPPPSPGPKYKLAEHRYGKEEMLALFSEDVEMPKELEMFDSICRNRPVLPLAFQPLTEEEQVQYCFIVL